MAYFLSMPQLQPGFRVGQVIAWLKETGEQVACGEPVCDIEGHKMTGQAEAERDGVLLRRLVEPGSKVAAGLPLAILGQADEDVSELEREALRLLQSQAEQAAPVAAEQQLRVVVIGGGPGGYVAALRAAQLGAAVTLIEQDRLGGTCLNRGCIPTKALLHSAALFHQLRSEGGLCADGVAQPDFAQLQQNKNAKLDTLRQGVRSLLEARGVQLVRGTARLADNHLVVVSDAEGTHEYPAERIILAVGSRPQLPPIPGLDHPRCLDSTGLLELSELPASLLVVGGGVIGIEMATVFSSFGVAVTVVEAQENMLASFDRELVGWVEDDLRQRGVELLAGTLVKSVSGEQAGPVEVMLERNGDSFSRSADYVLVSTGRVAATAGLGVEELGVRCQRGAIQVNQRMQTSVGDIYAVGDCLGRIMLAHTAAAQGEVAAENALGKFTLYDESTVPACVYTSPELAMAGYSEQQAIAAGIDYISGAFPLAGNGKCLIEGDTRGLVKVIAHRRTQKLLGVQIAGLHATELISGAVLGLGAKADLETVIGSIYPHPSVSEAIREAALSAAGRPLHQI